MHVGSGSVVWTGVVVGSEVVVGGGLVVGSEVVVGEDIVTGSDVVVGEKGTGLLGCAWWVGSLRRSSWCWTYCGGI